MTDAVFTEYAGTRKNDTIVRFYQYGNGGIRVLDARKNLKRLYRFDPSSDIMTEHDPARTDRVLRRLVFDRMGMTEEMFAPGGHPRTFRYEKGGEEIAVREGGEYGQVGKIITFEDDGVSETGWGRNGEIERVFVFESGNDTITERAGGYFGEVTRTILLEGFSASLFRDPEAFLQFFIFTEWSAEDRNEHISEQVAKIRGGRSGRASPYAYTGKERSSAGSPARTAGPAAAPSRSPPAHPDTGIDFIPDGDMPADRANASLTTRRSDSISFSERLNREEPGRMATGRSAKIPISERFENARSSREPLSKGRSVEIPLSERFESARSTREQLSKGRSVEIPISERFENSRREREPLSKGASVDIPLDERFENARSSREKLSRGRSAEIPYSERRGDRD